MTTTDVFASQRHKRLRVNRVVRVASVGNAVWEPAMYKETDPILGTRDIQEAMELQLARQFGVNFRLMDCKKMLIEPSSFRGVDDVLA